MFIDDKDFQIQLGTAECNGAKRARSTIIYVFKHKALIELDSIKKKWYEAEVKRLEDDHKWNLLE